MDQKLWERRPWDTEASYRAFADFYLVQEPERSLDAAYRAYRQHKGDSGDTAQRAPGTWRNWFAGKDSKGEYIPMACGWAKRAQAWDDYQNSLALEEDSREQLRRRKERRAVIDDSLSLLIKVISKLDIETLDL